MSAETSLDSPLFGRFWVALSLVLAVVFFAFFIFGDTFLQVGGIIWSVIRWLASPII